MLPRGTFPVTKFVRFNVIQAIFIKYYTCVLVLFSTFLPIAMRESVFGILFFKFLIFRDVDTLSIPHSLYRMVDIH